LYRFQVFGYRLDERLGSVHFWLILLGMNLTFGPMHILGLQGEPRRTYTYKDGYGLNLWNMVATIGAFVIAISVAVFLFNAVRSQRRYVKAGRPAEEADPWDARGLEWMVPSPMPAHNFDEVPVVAHLDEFWHRKYGEDDDGRPVRIAATEDVVQKGDPTGVHLPGPSYWPIVIAAGLPLIAYGLIYNLGFSALGWAAHAIVLLVLVLEPFLVSQGQYDGHDDGHGLDDGNGDDESHSPDDGGEPAAVTAGAEPATDEEATTDV
jgi:cytochrome c oxidase subunit 1